MNGSTSCSYVVPEPGFTFGSLRLEADGTLLREGAPVHLPPKELSALRLLLAHAGQIVTLGELKECLWPDVCVTPDSISKCMSSLRSRLEPEQCIQTIYKRGYRLQGEVRRDDIARPAWPRLVIAPFATGAHVPAHLGPGIAESATARLAAARLPRLSVLARDSVFTLARSGHTAQQIGEAMRADLALTGILHALALHFRLRVEMIRVADGTQIWSEDMLVSRDRLATLESELVDRLTYRLSVEQGATAAAGEFPADSPGYGLFLQGHHEWQTMERHRMQDGTEHLLQAAELEPALVSVRADLVNACAAQALYGFMAPSVAAEQARRIAGPIPAAAENAPAMLPVLAWFSFHVDHDLPEALRLYALCAHLPHDPWVTRMRVMFALSRHCFGEARELLEDALGVDPYAPWLHGWLAWTHHLAGNAGQSIEKIEESLRLFPGHESASLFGSVILAFNRQSRRAVELARSLLQRMPYFDLATAVYAYALACDGRGKDAQSILESLQWLGRERFALSSFSPAISIALDDVDGALAELRAAEAARCPWYFQMLADPRLARLQGNPKFEALCAGLRQMESAAEKSPEYAGASAGSFEKTLVNR